MGKENETLKLLARKEDHLKKVMNSFLQKIQNASAAAPAVRRYNSPCKGECLLPDFVEKIKDSDLKKNVVKKIKAIDSNAA